MIYLCVSALNMGPKTRNQPSISVDEADLPSLLSQLHGDDNAKLIVTVMLNQFDKLRTEIANKNQEISDLHLQLNKLKGTVSKLESTLDQADNYERLDTIILSGTSIPIHATGENCNNLVRELVKTKLKIELPLTEINTAHRLGKKPLSQVPDKRNIIVKLCRRETKRQLIISSRNQPSSSSLLYISESLTPRRSSILYALRRMKRTHPTLVTGCTSIDGNVYAFTNPTSPGTRNVRHLLNDHDSLVKFCREQVKRPLDDFLENWNF